MKIIIYTIILSFTTQTFARGGGDKGFKILDELSLSSEQVEKIEQFKSELKKKRESLKGDRKEHRDKMKKLFIEGASDSELRKLHESIKSHVGRHTDRKLEKMIFLKNVLNKEQRKTYIEKKKNHHRECRKRGPRKE